MTKKLSFRLHVKVFFGALIFTFATMTSAKEIASEPLFVGSSVDPNLMFVLDDSGSMRWGFMPDDLDGKFNLKHKT